MYQIVAISQLKFIKRTNTKIEFTKLFLGIYTKKSNFKEPKFLVSLALIFF